MTLNPGTDREKILLDIPDWDYDWQYSYRPVETIELQIGDVLRFECTWERSRRDPNLHRIRCGLTDRTMKCVSQARLDR